MPEVTTMLLSRFFLKTDSRQTEWRRGLSSLRSDVGLPPERRADCPEPPSRGGIARPYSRPISAVNQWRLAEQLRHFLAKLSRCISGTSLPPPSPSGTTPDILRCPENSKHDSISPEAV